MGFAEASDDSSTICDQDLHLDLSYDREPMSISETVERTPSQDTLSGPNPPPPTPQSTSYKPYSYSTPANDDGLQASHKFGISAVCLGLLILGLTVLTKHRGRRDEKFEEIQMGAFDDDGLTLS